MNLPIHGLVTDSFVPTLENLSAILDKGSAYADEKGIDLVNARLAPDMFTLAEQVQSACNAASDAVSRLTGAGPAEREEAKATIPDLKDQIARTIETVRSCPADAFEGAERRECHIDLPDDMVIELDGTRFLTVLSLPNFYFHAVTAYDILRQQGVEIGKMDYLRQIGQFIRKKA